MLRSEVVVLDTPQKRPDQDVRYIGLYGGFPKLGVPFLGVPIIRILIFWGLYWGPLILGNYHIGIKGLYKGYIGIMENRMEATIFGYIGIKTPLHCSAVGFPLKGLRTTRGPRSWQTKASGYSLPLHLGSQAPSSAKQKKSATIESMPSVC